MPSIVPSGPSQDVFLVLDHFGERLGRAWRETGENDADYETLIRHLLEGQCNNPVRVVAFNSDEGWSRDVSDDVADELQERCAQRGEVPDLLLDLLEAHDTGRLVQLPLPSNTAHPDKWKRGSRDSSALNRLLRWLCAALGACGLTDGRYSL